MRAMILFSLGLGQAGVHAHAHAGLNPKHLRLLLSIAMGP